MGVCSESTVPWCQSVRLRRGEAECACVLSLSATAEVIHSAVEAAGQHKEDLMEFLYADYHPYHPPSPPLRPPHTPTHTLTHTPLHPRCLLKGINLYSYWRKCLSVRKECHSVCYCHISLANMKVLLCSPQMCRSTDRDFRGLLAADPHTHTHTHTPHTVHTQHTPHTRSEEHTSELQSR